MIQSSTEPFINNEEQQLEDLPSKKVVKTAIFRVKATNSHCLEAFIEKIEQSIFHPKNVNTKVFHSVTKKEREALQEIKTWKKYCVRVQEKGSGFVVISNDE